MPRRSHLTKWIIRRGARKWPALDSVLPPAKTSRRRPLQHGANVLFLICPNRFAPRSANRRQKSLSRSGAGQHRHDSPAKIRRIPALLAQEKFQDRQAPESGDLFFAPESQATRTRGTVLQARLTRKQFRVDPPRPCASAVKMPSQAQIRWEIQLCL